MWKKIKKILKKIFYPIEENQKGEAIVIFLGVVTVVFLIGLIGLGMWGIPKYKV